MVDYQDYMNINGASLYVTRLGINNQRTIIFLHGGPGLGDSRADINSFRALAKEFQLIFLDLRGSGNSSDTPPFTHNQWVEDIEELRSVLNLEKIILHGSSYGGFIAQEYAVKYSENLEYLLLNVTTLDGTNDLNAINNAKNSDHCHLSDEELQRLFNGNILDNDDFRNLYAGILPLYMVTLDTERDQKKLQQIQFHYQTHNEAFRNLIHYDMSKQLPNMNVPTLITAGEVDWITPSEFSKEIHRLLPKSALVIFNGLGHSLVREDTELYIEILKSFIEGKIEMSNEIYDSGRFENV